MAEIPVVKPVERELNKKLLQDFRGERTGFVQVGSEKWFLPIKYEKFASALWNFEVRPDDTWIVTYPRSGTTVISELAWLVSNNVDIETAKKIPLTERVPFLEMNLIIHDEVTKELNVENLVGGKEKLEAVSIPNWERLNSAPSPRFIKSHLPIQLLPRNLLTCGAKVIYVARNTKDVAVSWYHMYRSIVYQDFRGDFEQFWDYFEKDLTLWSPYWEHIIGAWNYKKNPNLLFLFYEEYSKSSTDAFLKVSKFLKKTLTDYQLEILQDHLKFENFKKNKAVNNENLKIFKVYKEASHFVRQGKVGGWVDEFTPELTEKADKWIEDNLKKTDLRFPSL